MAKEMYDACDQAGNPLGYALVRGDPIPEGVWHLVVEVFSVTAGGRVLVTRRHPDKSWGGYWEYTGGSVLAGERPGRPRGGSCWRRRESRFRRRRCTRSTWSPAGA